ncbi:MAG: PQQ-binding-like beta-propeller repeat protein, partial [Gemmatimonadota bacterium]
MANRVPLPIVVAGLVFPLACESSSPSGPVGPMDLLWTRPIGLHAQSPQVAGGRVVYSDSGEVVALDLRSGELAWVAEFGFFRVGPELLAASNAVFVLGSGGELVALDAGTGDRLWEMAGCECLPLASDQTHVFAVREGRILAFQATTGGLAWDLPLPRLDWPLGGFAVGQDVFCVGQNEPLASTVTCLEAARGDLRWQNLGRERAAVTGLVATDGLVVAGTSDSSVLAFDL